MSFNLTLVGLVSPLNYSALKNNYLPKLGLQVKQKKKLYNRYGLYYYHYKTVIERFLEVY